MFLQNDRVILALSVILEFDRFLNSVIVKLSLLFVIKFCHGLLLVIFGIYIILEFTRFWPDFVFLAELGNPVSERSFCRLRYKGRLLSAGCPKNRLRRLNHNQTQKVKINRRGAWEEKSCWTTTKG